MIILFLILISSDTYAINLGSVERNSLAEISNSESAKFTMLFWNSESESYDVKLLVKDSPKDWVVIISPDEFTLNKSVGEEYISLPYSNENVKAKVVNIFVKPNPNSKLGNYHIIIKAETEIQQNESAELNVIPERLFKFEVIIKGFATSDNTVENNVGSPKNIIESNGSSTEVKNTVTENSINKEYFYSAIVLIVVIISIIIYKKSK